MQETCGEEIMALDKNSAIAVVVDFAKKAVPVVVIPPALDAGQHISVL
jgi:hypothetical protein